MSLLDYFKTTRAQPATASLAKERLQILVSHERNQRNQPSYLPQMKKELLEIIKKYVKVDSDAISINLEQDENHEVLELNIVLPDESAKSS